MKSAIFVLLAFTTSVHSFSLGQRVKSMASALTKKQNPFVRNPALPLAEEQGSTNVLEKEATTSTTTDIQPADETVTSTEFMNAVEMTEESEEELSETQKLMKQVKEAGTAGVISYALWELGFWAVSVPVVIVGYVSLTGHFPDLSNKEDTAKLGAEAFAFVNFARFAVPLRIGLALSTTPWIQENLVDRFLSKEDEEETSA